MNLDTLPLMGTLNDLCEVLNVSRYFAHSLRVAAGYGEQKHFQFRPVIEWFEANPDFSPYPLGGLTLRQISHRKLRKQICNLFDAGLTVMTIARKLQISRATVERHLEPEKHGARLLARQFVEVGWIVKPKACEHCSENKPLSMHHENYWRPLMVKWLCDPCHAAADFARRKQLQNV